jgi:hypothetical protein
MLPVVVPDELARRLQVPYPGGPLDAQLEAAVDVAGTSLTGHVDEALVTLHPGPWAEAVTQLAVKVWDTGNKGTAGVDQTGEWTLPAPAALPGLAVGVFGVLSPCMPTGGVTVA